METRFDFHAWPPLKARLGIAGNRDQYICLARYADNLVCVSPWLCYRCMSTLFCNIYKDVVPFEDESEFHCVGTSSPIKFVDVWVLVNWSGVFF